MSLFQRPYVSGGPTDYPSSSGDTILGVFLVDPITGNPVTPAGTVAGGGSGSAPAGVSSSGTVGTTSVVITTSGQFPHWMTVQNTHASNTLYVSFSGAATASDFAIAPGGALTLPSEFSNGLNAVGSAADTTYAIIGY